MCDWEEINSSLDCLWETFKENYKAIITYSFILLISLPILKWFLLSILYLVFKTDYLLEKFGESTAFSLLPWWLDFIAYPKHTLGLYLLCILILTCIYALFKKD